MFTLKGLKYKNILEIEGEFSFSPYRVICIVGESGSGKTTFLKLLNNLITPDRGKVFYKGKDVNTFDPVQLRREVIMLPQVPIIFPGTVKENLLKGLYFSEKPVVEDELILDILKELNVNVELNRDSAELSGGEKQRLALGRILLMEPEVFLLDEPTSALDDNTEDLALRKVVDFALQRGSTLIMVTHSRDLAYKYGQAVITLNGGRISKMEEANK